MSSSITTIPSLKSAFLNAQTRIFSQPFQPEALRKRKYNSGDPIPERVILDVTREVNRRIKRHSKSVYPSVAIRAVAEQIDNLYWQKAGEDIDDDDDSESNKTKLTLEDDLSDEKNIPLIPALIEDLAESSSTPSPISTTALEEQFSRLEDLSNQRAALERKLASYNTLLDSLEPFKNPLETIQPNLVTKDGPLAAELAKMRMLSLRVNGRLGEWVEKRQAGRRNNGEEDVEEEDIEWVDEEEKLKRALAL